MDVSVIIINYNTKDLLFNCLSSIYEHTSDVSFEIIVVDNASKDDSVKMVKDNFEEIRLFSLTENLGFGKANNIASKVAKGKYLFLLNSDTILLNNAIKLFFDFMEEQETYLKIGAIGTMLLNEKSKVLHSYGSFPNLIKDIENDIKTCIINIIGRDYYSARKKDKNVKTDKLQDDYFYVDYVTGADLFISKSTFDRYNGFDPAFFMYFEETDLQYRMFKDGLRSLIIDKPKIQHLEGASFKKKNDRKNNNKRMIYDRSHFYYYQKHFNKITYHLYRILFFIIQLSGLFDRSYLLKDRFSYLAFLTRKFD